MARFQIKFWLDSEKDDELLLMEEIDTLKRSRSFVSTVRDGIRLMLDLRAGKTDVLFSLFPDMREKVAPTSGGDDSGNDDIRREIETLKSLILQQSSSTDRIMSPRRSAAPQEEPELVIKKDTKTDSAQNFLNTLMALQG